MCDKWGGKRTTTADRDDGASKNEASHDRLVLIVDDNDEIREIVKQTLELSGYNVFEASDGEEALSVLQKLTKVDLILCDIILPRIKGPELIKEIHKVFPEVKVIFMSGYVNKGIISQDVDPVLISDSLFIQKPFLARELLTAIDSVLGN